MLYTLTNPLERGAHFPDDWRVAGVITTPSCFWVVAEATEIVGPAVRTDTNEEMVLRSLLYVSSAVHLLDRSQLLDLLQVSRTRNELADITGLLVYEEGSFIQVLEGPPQAVEETMRRIRNDFRHHHIMVLLDNEINERLFGSWAMAFATVDELTESGLIEFFSHNPDLKKAPRSQDIFKLLMTYRSIFDRGHRR